MSLFQRHKIMSGSTSAKQRNAINISNDNPQMRVVHSAIRLHKTDTVEPFSFKVLTKLTANLDTVRVRA